MFGLNNSELKEPNICDRLLPVWMKMFRTEIIKSNNLKFIDLDIIGTSEDGLFNVEYLKNIFEISTNSFLLSEKSPLSSLFAPKTIAS